MTDTNKRNVARQKIQDIIDKEPKDSLVQWACNITLKVDNLNQRVKKLEKKPKRLKSLMDNRSEEM